MTTSWRRVSVSLAASAIVMLSACATLPRRAMQQGCPPAHNARDIRFDNEGRERVHVYPVGQHGEWSLGRVEPGATTRWRIPAAALREQEFLRLAVIAGDRSTLRAAREPRAELTIAQPAPHILSQRWGFAQGQITSQGFQESRAPLGRTCRSPWKHM